MKKRIRVVGCILKYKYEILLLFRCEKETDPSLWGIPAGKVEEGESDADAIVREVYEETGIQLQQNSVEYLGLIPIEYDDFIVDFPIFAFDFENKPTVTLSPREHIDYQWIKPSEVLKLNNLMKDVDVIIKKFCIEILT